MSDLPAGNSKPTRPESRRSIIIVAVLCGSFLWWWFTLDPTPEAVGPLGLVDRALKEEMQEAPNARTGRPLPLDFDLLELAMGFLRSGKFNEATNLTLAVQAPILQARGLRAVAYGYLAKDSGAMGAALQVLNQITDPTLRDAAREYVLVDLTRLGFADIAWEQQPSLALKVSLIRNMAESDAQAEATRQLATVEPEVLALSPVPPALLAELAWTHLALRHTDQVFAMAPKLAPAAQDEIYLELFRMVRLDNPDLAKATLERLPAHLHWRARIEAAKLNGTLETSAQLLTELAAKVASEPTIEHTLLLTKAQWQLNQPETDAWRKSAVQLEQLLETAPVEMQLKHWLTLAQLYYDALDATEGHRLLERVRLKTTTLPDAVTRLPHLANLLDAAFRNAETNYVPQLLRDVDPDLQALPATLPEALTPALRQICVARFREGNWLTVLSLVPKFPPATQTALLTALADLPVESSAGQGFAVSQDESLASFRQVATSQGETEAAKLAVRQPTGLARARAWLEIAKGLVLKAVLDNELTSPPPVPM